jgi:predicted secreted protein
MQPLFSFSLRCGTVLLLLGNLLAAACHTATGDDHTGNNADTVIRVRANDSLVIRLSCNPGTGYSWLLPDSLPEEHLLYRTQSFTQGADKPGAAGIQTFYFQTGRPGRVRLRFLYVQPFNKPYPAHAKDTTFYILIQ